VRKEVELFQGLDEDFRSLAFARIVKKLFANFFFHFDEHLKCNQKEARMHEGLKTKNTTREKLRSS